MSKKTTGRDSFVRELIVDHLDLIDQVASRFSRKWPQLREDLKQVAREALVRAATRAADRGIGGRIPAYFIAAARGAMQQYIRDKVRMVRVPRSVHETAQPPFTDWCNGGGQTLATATETDEPLDPAERQELMEAINQLPQQQQAAVRLMHLMGYTGPEAARQIGVSRQHAVRLAEQGIQNLKKIYAAD